MSLLVYRLASSPDEVECANQIICMQARDCLTVRLLCFPRDRNTISEKDTIARHYEDVEFDTSIYLSINSRHTQEQEKHIQVSYKASNVHSTALSLANIHETSG